MSYETQFDALVDSKRDKFSNMAIEQESRRLSTVYFPKHHNLSLTRETSFNTDIIIVRDMIHDNNVVSYTFGLEVWQLGQRLNNKELLANGFGFIDSYTGKQRSQINPLSGLRVAYRNDAFRKETKGKTNLYRVNKDGDFVPFTGIDDKVKNLADATVRRSLWVKSFAQRESLRYPDLRSFTGNLDRHMPQNCAITTLKKNITGFSVDDLEDYSTLDNVQFLAAFADI